MPPLNLGHRAILLPIDVEGGQFKRRVFQVARRLEADQADAAEQVIASLERLRGLVSGSQDDGLGLRSLLRAEALCRVLVDLHEGGWGVSVEQGQLFALAPVALSGDPANEAELRRSKERVRRGMLVRVRDQLSEPGAARLVDEVEGPDGLSVGDLIADGAALAASLRDEGAGAVRPYLQPARGNDGRCQHTGLRLHSIFRYFRHLWSFPYGDTPGRSLPILIRDAGQPHHPVCGLLCLSSPVLRLRVRDEELGLAPGWLEAVCAGLDLPHVPDAGDLRAHLRGHLSRLERDLRELARAGQPAPRPARVLEDLSALLGVEPCHEARALAWHLSRLGPARLELRLRGARRRLLGDLLGELEGTMLGVSLEGLGVDEARLRHSPSEARAHLVAVGEAAKQEWHAAREREHQVRAQRDALAEGAAERAALDEAVQELRRVGNEALFKKKRALQLASTLKAWGQVLDLADVLVEPLGDDGSDPVMVRLREHTSHRLGPYADGAPLTGGQDASRGLREALQLRKVRIAASQIAEVSLCGAVPPYRDLLGGKLAALLALSREASRLWHDAYADQRSEIQSKMAGETVTRPSELLALTTTSLYGVGSAQYNRLRLPPELQGLEWRQVGETRGHGTLHFSSETSRQMAELIAAETGRKLITSTFGEGPSERLRKLRDGLKCLGLPEDELVRHGMTRLVYVASLSGSTRPGLEKEPNSHHEQGPTVDQIAQYWRDRWLSRRIRSPGRLDRLQGQAREGVLLSTVFAEQLDVARERLAAAARGAIDAVEE